MPEPAKEPDASLTGALGKVIDRLEDKFLLFALGAGILLVILALAGPDGGQVYAVVLAVLLLAVAVIRAVLDGRKGEGGGGAGNVIDADGRARVEGNTMSLGGPASNRISAKGRARVKGNRMQAGVGREDPE